MNKCWLCGRNLEGGVSWTRPPQAHAALHAPQLLAKLPNTYSLSTLFLLVTLACVLLGISAAAPGLGIPLAVMALPALIRTFASARVKGKDIASVSAPQAIGAFVLSLGVVFLVVIAASIAFLAACFVTCVGLAATSKLSSGSNYVMIFAFGVPGLFALYVAIRLLIRTWPGREQP